ncbi:MAG: hypothetical protein OWQ54_03530 [Sulfolobaceae archaeon]|nr:hypothetical protein [Sulfolobaceae archaeon]
MRWLRKREVIIYFLLYSKFRYQEFDIGEAFKVLEPYFSKKVIKNSIKYLSKIGLITGVDKIKYRLNPFEDFVLFYVGYQYLQRRAKLHHKAL